MNIFLAAGILYINFFGANPGNGPQIHFDEYCELKGSVFIEKDPSSADFRVFIEESEAFADFLVFETDNSLYADKAGLWYYIKNRGMSDFTVCLVDSKNKADFSICYTTYESMAGCSR